STATLPVFGMQNTAAMCDSCGFLSLTSPAGIPVAAIRRVAGWPNAPAFASVWPTEVHMRPSVAGLDAVPVVSGVRSTGSCAWKPGSGGRQSRVVSNEPAGAHALPLSSPGEPFTSIHDESHVPEMHVGQGDMLFPVM